MAELDDGLYDPKYEELVDFEGSDYGFGSDEELALDDEEGVALPIEAEEIVVPALDLVEAEEMEIIGGWRGGEPEPKPEPAPEVEVAEAAAAPGANVEEPEKQEGAESGEIEEDREEKDDGVVAQPVPSLNSLPYSRGGGHRHEEGGRVRESRRRHRKADLEDGELDDAAMPEGSDHEAEGNADDDDDDEKGRRERKRRKDRFAAERRSEDPTDRKERELGSLMSGPGRQHRSRARHMDRSGSLSKVGIAVGRGMMQMSGGFSHPPNMAPGIMGPGGPLVPLDMGPGAMSLHPMGRGFMGPLGGMPLPHGVSFQEAMAVHEHMMRSHRMMQQMAQAASGPGRPMPGPMGGPAVRPVMGLDYGGPVPRGMLHMPPHGPDMASAQMNFAGPMDGYERSPRTGYGSGRGGAAAAGGGVFGQGTGRMGSSPRNGMGRQSAWSAPASAQGSDSHPHPAGRGRGLGRGQGVPPVWADPQGLAMTQGPAAQTHGAAQSGSMGPGMMAGTRVNSRTHRGHRGSAAQLNQSPREGFSSVKRTESGGSWKGDGDRSGSNGGPVVRSGSNSSRPLSGSAPAAATGNKRDRENGRENHSGSNSGNAQSGNVLPHGNGANTPSNLIQLGGPVQKSRFLTVSGLPESTSMSVVVEAFEKQGKVMDFRKEERGGAFTITFASIPEAISAKRHMHRSIVAGHQITVEYAVKRTEA